MTSTSDTGRKNISVADNLVTLFTSAGITDEEIKNISRSHWRCQSLIHQLENLQTFKSEELETFITKLNTADTAVIHAVRALCQACFERDKIMRSYDVPPKGEKFEKIKAAQHVRSEIETLSKLKVSLTEQERKVVHLLKIGKTSKEIAVQLQLTVKTVRTYRERVLRKTKTRNVAELLNVCFHF